MAVTPREKALALHEYHFPEALEVDLSDIEDIEYPTPIEIPKRVTTSEVLRSVKKTKPNSTLGPSGAPNRVIKIIAYNSPKILRRLFQAYLE